MHNLENWKLSTLPHAEKAKPLLQGSAASLFARPMQKRLGEEGLFFKILLLLKAPSLRVSSSTLIRSLDRRTKRSRHGSFEPGRANIAKTSLDSHPTSVYNAPTTEDVLTTSGDSSFHYQQVLPNVCPTFS